jgi:hypothetical protein
MVSLQFWGLFATEQDCPVTVRTRQSANFGGNMDLPMVLDFIRSTDVVTWDLMIDEMNATRRKRNVEAAKSFELGDPVIFEIPNGSDRLEGRVIRVTRGGRLVLIVPSNDGGLPQRVSVPAIYVKRVA